MYLRTGTAGVLYLRLGTGDVFCPRRDVRKHKLDCCTLCLRDRLCCLMSTEASRPIRHWDEWEKEDRRVKPRNRR